jgi:lipid-A-disaccharide synthase-like uncharacterized protein
MFDLIPHWLVYTVGFTASIFFTLRMLIQWLSSEKTKKVQSPASFWIFSVIGSCLQFTYGVMRDDFSIILGQLVSFYVYIWNLKAKGIWAKIGVVTRTCLMLLPVAAVVILLGDAGTVFRNLFKNEDIPMWLIILGTTGQLIFAFRFPYQWWFGSHHGGISVFPRNFWIISIVGSGIILVYAIIRLDPVLIVSQVFGITTYIRNLIIGFNERKVK